MNERMKEPSSEGSWSFKFWGHFECIQWSFRGTEKKKYFGTIHERKCYIFDC